MAQDATKIEAGRLALREDGEFWVAYFAPLDSMEGAMPLASIGLRFLPGRRAEFITLAKALLGDMLSASGLTISEWGGEDKPLDSERTRNA